MADLQLVACLQAMEGADQRVAALKALVQSLTVIELRTLSDIVNERQDAISRLPVELFHEIFTHLPFLSAWRLQLVSQQWRTLLSSPSFLIARFAWAGRLPLTLTASAAEANEETVRLAIRHMRALRLGRPFAYYESRVHLPDPNRSPRNRESTLCQTVALHHRTIAYARSPVGGGSDVVVRDLSTGHERTFCGEAREAIMCITLADDVLGFVSTQGVLYVADLRAPETSVERLRLPSAHVEALTSDGDAVALRMAGDTVVVYSCTTRRLSSYQLPVQFVTGSDGSRCPLSAAGIILDTRRRTLDVFGHVWSSADSSSGKFFTAAEPPGYAFVVGHRRFALDPNNERGACTQPLLTSVAVAWPAREPGEGGYTLGEVRALGDGRYRIWTHVPDMIDHDGLFEGCILFDARTAQVFVQQYEVPDGTRQDYQDATVGYIVRWKDTHYSFYPIGTREHLAPFSPVQGDCAHSDRDAIHLAYRGKLERDWRKSPDEEFLAAFANDWCLVVFTTQRHPPSAEGPLGRVSVFWFDELAPLADGLSTGFWETPVGAAGMPWALDTSRALLP
ncbi:hypothetical protein LTR53_009745 [Teratosphaeriaceae sp. CCFEE 6253]|nr:hypothetical protein LTR53_009745 [Teratosphaeriaceae sp. CCFEE 6253]